MPAFAGRSRAAMINTSIEDDAGSYACSHAGVKDIAISATGTPECFCQRRGIGIVFKRDRSSQLLLDFVPDGESLKPWKIRRADDQSGIHVDKTGNADSHAA